MVAELGEFESQLHIVVQGVVGNVTQVELHAVL